MEGDRPLNKKNYPGGVPKETTRDSMKKNVNQELIKPGNNKARLTGGPGKLLCQANLYHNLFLLFEFVSVS